MKIEDARVRYNVQIKTYYSKQKELYAQKQKLEEKIKTTENGAEVYKDESAILELQYSAVDEKRQEYQDYMDKLMEQWRMISDKIASKQQSDAMADQAKEMNKIMLVARRIMHGDKVPAKDEKKLMEYDDVDLEFTDDALNAIADKAIERNIGARGLRAVMEGLLTKIMYEIPSDKTVVKAVVTKDCVEGKAEPELTHDSNKINYSVKLNTGKSEVRNEADTPMSAS